MLGIIVNTLESENHRVSCSFGEIGEKVFIVSSCANFL